MQSPVETPTQELPVAAPPPAAPPPPPDGRRRTIMLAGGTLLAVALILLLAAIGFTRHFAGRIYPGVAVAGVGLSGLTRDAAIARLEARERAYLAAPAGVGVQPSERRWTVAPGDLGVRFDTAAAVDRALAYGRGRGPLANTIAWYSALLPGGVAASDLPATIDDDRLDGALRGWAPDATYFPTDAAFSVADGDRLTIVADRDGLGFAFEGSRDAFLGHAARLHTAPVRLATVAVPAAITASMLQSVSAQAKEVISQPLMVSANGRSWTLDTGRLGGALGYRLDNGQLVVALDANRLGPFLDEVAAGVAQPGANARLVANAAGIYQIQPERPGVVLDREATLAAIDAALNAGRHSAAAQTRPQIPAIVAADLPPVQARLERILGTPLRVTFAGGTVLTLNRADLQPLIRLTETPGAAEPVAIALDPAKQRALAQRIAGALDQPVVDADFRWIDGVVQERRPSQEGRATRVEATNQRLGAAILAAAGTVEADVQVTKPQIASADRVALVFPDRLGYGETDYSFSVPPRKHNVELSVERLNGAVVPPGGIFSFNAAVGAQTIENGYQAAYGIALVPGQGGKPGQATTVSSVGGGICQVATTLFQGVFRSGMAIEERNWHLYWPIHYGPPYTVTGMQGLDATVDDQSGLDFRFRNLTGRWVAIKAVTTNGRVQIGVYGVNPGWRVEIADPVITDVVKADPKRVEEKTHDIPPGKTLQVEEAGDGFTAVIHRRVVNAQTGAVITFTDDQGEHALDTSFKSIYVPSRNVFQVGVPADQPTDPPANP